MQTNHFTHSLALVIGINVYGGGIPLKTTAANDAARLAHTRDEADL